MKEENNKQGRECPECGSQSFSSDARETFCNNCGTIIDDQKIKEKEYRAYGEEEKEKKARVGSSVTYTQPDKGFTTKVGNSQEVNKVAPKKRNQYHRMKKWNTRMIDSKRNRRKELLRELRQKSSEFDLPQNVHEETARIAIKAQDEGLVRGRSKEDALAACIYIVCKQYDVPLSLSEICEECENSKRKIAKTYRYIARELGIQIKHMDPVNYLPKYASELGASGRTRTKAKELIEEGKEKHLFAGKSPKGVVGAALYIASKMEGEKINQREISKVTGVTPVTIRSTRQDMREELQISEMPVA